MTLECKRHQRSITPGEMNLIFRARLIWRNLATWMLIYLGNLFGNQGNLEVLKEKLYETTVDYVNLMRLVYGERIAEIYSSLLTVYITNLILFFDAMKEGNQPLIDEYMRRIRESIDQRAAFLGQINPYWQEATWKALLHGANNMLIEMATTYMRQEYRRNLDVYSRLLEHTNLVGDYFSQGLMDYLILDGSSDRLL